MRKLTFTYEKKQGKRKSTHKASAFISSSEDVFGVFSRLWKSILTSNLHSKDKAEILRLLIFAFTVIIIIALFVLNRF